MLKQGLIALTICGIDYVYSMDNDKVISSVSCNDTTQCTIYTAKMQTGGVVVATRDKLNNDIECSHYFPDKYFKVSPDYYPLLETAYSKQIEDKNR